MTTTKSTQDNQQTTIATMKVPSLFTLSLSTILEDDHEARKEENLEEIQNHTLTKFQFWDYLVFRISTEKNDNDPEDMEEHVSHLLDHEVVEYEGTKILNLLECLSNVPYFINLEINRSYEECKTLSLTWNFHYNFRNPTKVEIKHTVKSTGELETDLEMTVDHDWNVRGPREQIIGFMENNEHKHEFCDMLMNRFVSTELRDVLTNPQLDWHALRQMASKIMLFPKQKIRTDIDIALYKETHVSPELYEDYQKVPEFVQFKISI